MQTKLKIEGMTCEMCVRHVTNALQNTPGVSRAAVVLETDSAMVEGNNFDNNQLIEAVREEGYGAQIISE